MKIGVDLDDVLADFRAGWLTYHNKRYNTNYESQKITTYKLEESMNIDVNIIIDSIMSFYRTKLFEEINPIFGSRSVINRMKECNTMSIITSRPTWLEVKTKNWIEKHYRNSFENVILSNQFGNKSKKNISAKSQICKECGINLMIEDAPTYALEVANADIKVLLLDRVWNRDIEEHENITRVNSWRDIEKCLKDINN
jgi:uncharacterized HAD superfamily protein